MIKSTLDELLKMISEEENQEEKIKFNVSAPAEHKSLREEAAKKFLLRNAAIHDINAADYNILELELRRAFDAGMKIIEHSNNYYLQFNLTTKRYIKKFATPIDSVMALNENVEYSWEVQDILSGLEPDGKQIRSIGWEKINSSRIAYMDSIKTPEIKKLMYGDLLDEKRKPKIFDDNKDWDKLFEFGKMYDGDKMKDTLVMIRECGGFLAKSNRWGYVIDTEKLDDESMSVYEKTIKPYLLKHREWLMRTLKKISE